MSKEKKNVGKVLKFFIFIFSIIALFISFFAIYEIFLLSNIENLIRYILIAFLGFIDLIILVRMFKKKKRLKKRYLVFLIFYSIICGLVGGLIFYIYGQINGINKQDVVYTSDLLVMSSSNINSISDIKDMKLGILSDTKSPDGYIIPREIIDDNKLEDDNEMVEYDDYTTMLVDLYSKEIDGMFVSDSYVSMFSGITGYENIESDTKVIISKDKKMKKASVSKIETASSGKDVTEPFTILLMGIDSTDDVLSKNAIANGDTLILITFNPKTLNATMLSIPRDSYIPIACWSGMPENKITHAAIYGNDCMINTIENYFDTKIDYYAKINFKGLVKLVNAVGGVEVDVPKELCTDDSSRGGEVCIKAGRQTLNGEEALVFARNRKQLANGTFGREAHQQELIMALINKMKNVTDVTKFMEILNTVSDNLDTNLTTKQILSFYNIGKDIVKKSLSSDDADLISVQQLFLQGEGQMIYDERAKMVLWDYVPNKSSRKDIIQAMKENLELEPHTDIKEFTCSINKPYKKEIIGEGPYSSSFTYVLLPDFTGLTEKEARTLAAKYDVKVAFTGNSGTVIEQSEPVKKRVDKIDILNLKLSNTKDKDDDKDDEKCDEKDSKCKSKETTKTTKKEDVDTSKEETTTDTKDDKDNISSSDNYTDE